MFKLKSSHILVELFLSFLLIVVPMVILGGVMLFWEKKEVEDLVKTSALDDISFLQNNLENEIQRIQLLQYNLPNDTSLSKLVTQYGNLPVYDYYTAISDVQQRLQIMKNSNNHIDDVRVFIRDINYMISATNGCREMEEEEFEEVLAESRAADTPLLCDDTVMKSLSGYPIGSVSKGTPLYIVEVTIANRTVEGFISKFSKYNSADTALYDYSSQRWIFGKNSRLRDAEEAKASCVIHADKSREILETDVDIQGEGYYVLSAYSSYLNMAFVKYIPVEEMFSIPNRYQRFLIVYFVLLCIMVVLYSVLTYRLVKQPVNELLKAFSYVERGDLDIRIQRQAAREFNVLFEGFNKMVLRLHELVERVYKQELHAKRMELKQLQSQMNPHFLYNSYFMLNRLIKSGDLESAEALSFYLGDCLRFITRDASDEIFLKDELRHASSYANIQQMRFARRLSVSIEELPAQYQEVLVPRMILQPVLENAFQYGVGNRAEKGVVRLCFEQNDEGMRIVVEDSGSGLKDSDIEELRGRLTKEDETIETTGLINIHRRLRLRYGRKSGILVSRSALGGLRVDLAIPLE